MSRTCSLPRFVVTLHKTRSAGPWRGVAAASRRGAWDRCAWPYARLSRVRRPEVGPDQSRGRIDPGPSPHFPPFIYEPENIPKSHDICDSISGSDLSMGVPFAAAGLRRRNDGLWRHSPAGQTRAAVPSTAAPRAQTAELRPPPPVSQPRDNSVRLRMRASRVADRRPQPLGGDRRSSAAHFCLTSSTSR